MRVGIFVTARLGSSRLPGKHLASINGRPGLHYLTERIRQTFCDELNDGCVTLVITTSTAAENRAFCDVVPDAQVFFGDSEHIPRRHLQAAWTYGLDAIVSVDGDDILCSPRAMRVVYDMLVDRAKRVSTSGLPLGMNAWGYSTEMLAKALDGNVERRCDTGWGRVFDDREEEGVVEVDVSVPSALMQQPGDRSGAPRSLEKEPELRLTLDYEEDLAFFRALIGRLGADVYTATDAEIIRTIRSDKLHTINAAVVEAYWTSFHAEKAEQAASVVP